MATQTHPPLDEIKAMDPLSHGEHLNPEGVHLSENWFKHADAGMTLQKFLDSSDRIDSIIWSQAYDADPEKCKEGWNRFVGNKHGLHLVPGTIDCDRTFLRHRRDAAYLEAAVKYLRGVSSIPPMLTPSVWFYPYIGDLENRIRAKNWAIGAAEASRYYKRLISPTDWASFSKMNIQGRFKCPRSGEKGMIIEPHTFPKMQTYLCELDLSCHLGIELPRVGFYFGHTVRLQETIVKTRYHKLFKLETKVQVMVSFMEDVYRGRVWDIRREHGILFKSEFPFPSIPYTGECETLSELGDLSNVLQNKNLWGKYSEVMRKATERFVRAEQVTSGKTLQCGEKTSCFDSRLLNVSVGENTRVDLTLQENMVQNSLSQNTLPAMSSTTPSVPFSSRHSGNRPRMANTAMPCVAL